MKEEQKIKLVNTWTPDTERYKKTLPEIDDAVVLKWPLQKDDYSVLWAHLGMALGTTHVDGMVLEFGVAHGNSVNFLARWCAPDVVHGFDSFLGLPEPWEDKYGQNPSGLVRAGTFDRKGEPPKVLKNVVLHSGWFADTIPEFLDRYKDPVRFLHIDCDLYSSTKTILDAFGEAGRIIPGTVVAFDELWNYSAWRHHEWKAFIEACKRFGWEWRVLNYIQNGYQVAVRLI